jgi:putative transport protein
MRFELTGFFFSPYMLITLTVVTGFLFGKIRIKHVTFGLSGCLITGIPIGWGIWLLAQNIVSQGESATDYKLASQILDNGIVSMNFFYFSLIIFLAAVGLLAAKDIGGILKNYGWKFVILSIQIPLIGAIATYIATRLMSGGNKGFSPFLVSGTYTGAYTSSPGLAAAIENTAIYGTEAQALVSTGHTIAYAFGCLVVVLFVQLAPYIFKLDMIKERENLEKLTLYKITDLGKRKEIPFNVATFCLVIFLGLILGNIGISLGSFGWISLGTTGGVLIVALILGYLVKLGPFHFQLDSKLLGAFRSFGLVCFLSVVALRYGHYVIEALTGIGIYLVLISIVVASIGVFSGFLLGYYIFHINWVILAGAICGSMTSTPGLGAAIDATKSDKPGAGYGASYPFAILCMVLFSALLHHLPL